MARTLPPHGVRRRRLLRFGLVGLVAHGPSILAPVARADDAAPEAAADATTDVERPHIAALLPLKSAALGKLAEAVRRGLAVAAQVDQNPLPLIVYPVGDEVGPLVDTYDRALRAGAQFVIGPLSKPAVAAIATSGAVTAPTLALSIPDSEVALPDGMYAIGIQLEAEARQIARIAASQGRRRASIVALDTPLARRVAQAFADEWTRTTRPIVDNLLFNPDPVQLKKLRDTLTAGQADMVFLALDGTRARQVKPYLGRALPAYGTSQVHVTTTDATGQMDLNGLVFVDMPWLLMPDHPAVMLYPRPTLALPAEQARFFGLGIDAWRIAQALLGGTSFNELGDIDGVTGHIRPGAARQFVREPFAAQFAQGQPRLLSPTGGR
ncbi:MAG: penicillin-binding protein activator [Burkholderiales bacterium]|jgi:hypothetical protein|nr:penicillin-binding protein activator [Burkholderiales bacterium]